MKLEAEPRLYKNTFILSNEGAIQKLLQQTLSTPERKLLLKSVELSLSSRDFTIEDGRAAESAGFKKWYNLPNNPWRYVNPGRPYHHLAPPQQSVVAWQRKFDPVVEYLALDRLVLDLRYSFCSCCDNNRIRMATTAIRCFQKGFKLQAPGLVEVKGWDDAGRADPEVVVRECLRAWTSRRASRLPGSADPALDRVDEAEEWLLNQVSYEAWQVSMRSDFLFDGRIRR